MTDRITLTVPADEAEHSRAALIDLLGADTDAIRDNRDRVATAIRERSAHLEGDAEDLRAATGQLAQSARLLEQVGYEGAGEIEIVTDDPATLAGTFETMARTVGSLLTDALDVTPLDDEYAATLRPLVERLSWAIDHSARFHDLAVAQRKAAA